jgi:hypothetical protein
VTGVLHQVQEGVVDGGALEAALGGRQAAIAADKPEPTHNKYHSVEEQNKYLCGISRQR